MGQKINPIGMRLGITKPYNSIWYASTKDFPENIRGDFKVRRYLFDTLQNAQISRVVIDRPNKSIRVTIFTGRPASFMEKTGAGERIEELRAKIAELAGVPANTTLVIIKQIMKPDLNARLVAENIAQQLEKRVMFRRAMKKALQGAMKAGAKGIKVQVSGRLGGAEIARTEWLREGRVPLHTLRADIDYSLAEAVTTYGVIGVKVWIFKGEGLPEKRESRNARPKKDTGAASKGSEA